jgi:hypothetical protein
VFIVFRPFGAAGAALGWGQKSPVYLFAEPTLSALTKILVVLVTVLVLVQTAATVVFVHRVDTAVVQKNSAEDKQKVDEAKIAVLQSELSAAQAQVSTVRQQTQSQVTALQQQVLTAQQKAADQVVEIAKLSSAGVLQGTDLARLTEALRASEDTKSKQADAIAELRNFNADNLKKLTELNSANGDLTNRLEVTERERRFLQEQNVELQNQLSHASTTQPTAVMALPGATKGPAINATVRATSTIANIPFATISVGTADRVSKGMTFTLIDSQGNFLGYLTVDTVDTNEAAGRLTGPRVADVKVGTDARTQL